LTIENCTANGQQTDIASLKDAGTTPSPLPRAIVTTEQ